MKEEIETTLHPLLGEPLSDMWRYGGFQKFEFGVQRPYKNRKGQDITRADWGLVVACDWRITGPEGIVVSSDDFGAGDSRCDEKAYPFYQLLEDDPPIVETIKAEDTCAVRIYMTRGYLLEVLPDGKTDEEDNEQWRFMSGKTRPHLVIVGEGIER